MVRIPYFFAIFIISNSKCTILYYADDFLIGVIGSFEDASEIKDKFRVFLEDTLHLEMSEEKTKIMHSQDKARFLGYDITTAKNSALMYDSKHQLRKTHTGRIKLYAPSMHVYHLLRTK